MYMEDPKSAEAEFRAALEKGEHENPVVLTLLGAVLSQQGHHARACGYFNAAIKLRPQYTDAHFNMALALMERGEYSAAQSAFLNAFEDGGLSAHAHYAMGILMIKTRRPTLAVKCFQAAMHVDSRFRDHCLLQLGAVKADLRDYEGAAEAYQEVVASPTVGTDTCAEALRRLGDLALQRDDDVPLARDYYIQALRLEPTCASATAGLNRCRKTLEGEEQEGGPDREK